MSSWVRYSVTVYLGLLMSGALARPPMYAPNSEPDVAPRVHHEVAPPGQILPPTPDPNTPINADVSV